MGLKLGANETYRDELELAAQRTGIDASALAALIDAEAARKGGVWQADSFNSTSRAAGLTQFLTRTWIEQAERQGTLLNEEAGHLGYLGADGKILPARDDDVLALRYDARLSIVAAAEYGVANLNQLKARNLVPDGIGDDERAKLMYLAHHEGAGGAAGFLSGTRKYTRQNLVGQVGATAADRLIGRANGNANLAYRQWMQDYIDLKIVPGKFRDSTAAAVLQLAGGLTTSAPAVVSAGLPVGLAYVSTDQLNLRATPDPNGAILTPLDLGTEVQVTGPAQGRWQPVLVGGQAGFASNIYLRAPVAPTREALLKQVVAEWKRFNKGSARENQEPYAGYIGQMWAAIGQNLTGMDTDMPWSAAFISWVVRNAGPAYRNFAFSTRHSTFSNDAIQARILGKTDRPFWGYRITDKKPELGDIIHRNRGGNTFTFDFAENHSSFISHSDVVVEVREHVVRVMGGNVGNTVSMAGDPQEYDLDANGFLKPGQKIIALLKNRADQVV